MSYALNRAQANGCVKTLPSNQYTQRSGLLYTPFGTIIGRPAQK